MHGQLARVRITADLAEQVTAVTAAGWDAGAGNAVKHSTTSITHAGPGRGKSGPEWAQDAFGQRSEHLAGFSVASDEEASALTDCRVRPARAPLRLRRRHGRRQCAAARRRQGGHQRCLGAVRQHLLRDAGPPPVRPAPGLPHRVPRRMRLPGERLMKRDAAFTAPAPWMQAAMLARVVSLNDPQGLNRVQIRLLAYDDVDQQDAAVWARVVCPFAGNDRGAFFLPDVDDEVMVIFVQGDSRHPLVIGGLWNVHVHRARRHRKRRQQPLQAHQVAQRHRHHAGRTGRAGDAEARNARRPDADAERRPPAPRRWKTATATASSWNPRASPSPRRPRSRSTHRR